MVFAVLLKFIVFNIVGLETYRGQEDVHAEKVFDCRDGDPVVISNPSSRLRSALLLSPCYPRDYRSCSYFTTCSIRLENIPSNLWVGLQALSTSQSMDEMAIHINNALVTRTNISTGLLYSTFLSRPTNLTVTLNRRMSIATSSSATFSAIIILANAMDRGADIFPPGDGFIVSHSKFDYGQKEENYYTDGSTTSVSLIGLTQTDKLHLTFFAVGLAYIQEIYRFSGRKSNHYCEDYIEIQNVRGYSDNKTTICGFDRQPLNGTEYFPTSTNITFVFVTRPYSSHQLSESAGFLFRYTVAVNEDACPPYIQNALPAVPVNIGSSNTYIIRCEDGYRIENGAKTQAVGCMNGDWRTTVLPCIATSCDLPTLPTTNNLNFSMSTTGRATVGTTLTFFCNDQEQVLSGNTVLTCTDAGVWSGALPSCVQKATTCDLPTLPTTNNLNFSMSTTGRATVGTTLTFFCNDQEQVLSDNTVLICTETGVWSGALPSCVPKAQPDVFEQETIPGAPPLNAIATTLGEEHPVKAANKLVIGLCVGVTAAIIIGLLTAFFIKQKKINRNRENTAAIPSRMEEETRNAATVNAHSNGGYLDVEAIEPVRTEVERSKPRAPLAIPRQTHTTATEQFDNFYENTAPVMRRQRDRVDQNKYPAVMGATNAQLTLAELIENDLYHT